MTADPNAPDKIDTSNLKKLPKGAVVQANGYILYMGAYYSGITGEKVDPSLMDPTKATQTTFSGLGTIQGLAKSLGLSDIGAALPRLGLILLGAALCIIGIAMFVSGTKTADLLAELTPVGKVLT